MADVKGQIRDTRDKIRKFIERSKHRKKKEMEVESLKVSNAVAKTKLEP